MLPHLCFGRIYTNTFACKRFFIATVYDLYPVPFSLNWSGDILHHRYPLEWAWCPLRSLSTTRANPRFNSLKQFTIGMRTGIYTPYTGAVTFALTSI